MLQRGARNAAARGVGENLEFVEADLNHWVAAREYSAVMADQSLHHVMDLEWLFGQIRQSLRSDGVFVVSDMIGRNGHLRWPEALEIVHELWQKLPPSYRVNCRTGRYEAVFEDTDCSTESFEGIRAQDILPLLSEYFQFEFFLGFGNLIDPFVDRSFGPHFDAAGAWDREFIDHVHRRDQEEFASGRLKPTHMLAILGKHTSGIPALTTRPPGACVALKTAPVESGYDWESWPHTPEDQLKIVCGALEDSEKRVRELEAELRSVIALAEQRDIELQHRTDWALELDHLCEKHEEELVRRTSWARKLEAQLTERTAWALRLDSEWEERTQWALGLDREVAALREALRQPRGLRRYLHHARRLALRLVPGKLPRTASRKLSG